MIDGARLRAKNHKAAIAFEGAAAERLPFASEQFYIAVPSRHSASFKMQRRCSGTWHACCGPRYWRARQVELLGGRAPRSGMMRFGAVATSLVPKAQTMYCRGTVERHLSRFDG
jgi:hypothetical protein